MASATDPVPRSSTRYRPLRLLARGGLSAVFLARDEELNRDVAMKVMHGRHGTSAWGRSRLLFEAEVTAGLEHPGVVPVYGLGEDESGRPYFAMRYVVGENLSEAAGRCHSLTSRAARGRALRRLVDRLVDVCYTVDFANRRGVIHRDLTPRNVMLGLHGETLVVDWGLARCVGVAGPDEAPGGGASGRPAAPPKWSSETRIGASVGTPRYMSPEQAAGRWDRLGPATDVFGLGATLYRLVTGTAPFAADDTAASEAKALRVECPAPREVDRRLPTALESICLTAMMPDQADRYPSAVALGADLARWVAGEPVSVPRGPTLRRWKARSGLTDARAGAAPVPQGD